MKQISTLSEQVCPTDKAKNNSNSLILKKKFFLIVMGKSVQGLSNFPKLSLYTQVQISVVSYFTGIGLVSFSLQDILTGWNKCLKHGWSLFHYSLILKKKKSEHPWQGGGESKESSYQGWGSQGRKVWCNRKHTLWKQLMSCPSVQTEWESAFSRLRRAMKSLLGQSRETHTDFKHFSICKESVRQQFSLKEKKKKGMYFLQK